MDLKEMIDIQMDGVEKTLDLTWKDDMPKTKEEVLKLFRDSYTISLSYVKLFNENLFKEVEEQFEATKKMDKRYL